MDFRDGRTVEVKEGEILIVPKGVEHKPHTNGDIVFSLLFEPKATLHTGTVQSDMTVKELDWIQTAKQQATGMGAAMLLSALVISRAG